MIPLFTNRESDTLRDFVSCEEMLDNSVTVKTTLPYLSRCSCRIFCQSIVFIGLLQADISIQYVHDRIENHFSAAYIIKLSGCLGIKLCVNHFLYSLGMVNRIFPEVSYFF